MVWLTAVWICILYVFLSFSSSSVSRFVFNKHTWLLCLILVTSNTWVPANKESNEETNNPGPTAVKTDSALLLSVRWYHSGCRRVCRGVFLPSEIVFHVHLSPISSKAILQTGDVSRAAPASDCALILECHSCPAKTPVQPRFLSEQRQSQEAF